MAAHPTHVHVLVRTRPWLAATAVLLAVLCMTEGALAMRALGALGPMPEDLYLAGRWSAALMSMPVHGALSVGSALLVGSLVGQIAAIGRLKQEGREEELLATLRHLRRFWRRAAVTALSMLGLGCAGGLVALALALEKIVAIMESTP